MAAASNASARPVANSVRSMLVSHVQSCHWGAMTDNQKPASSAGGIFLAICLLTGAGIGIYLGQPSLGILVGLAAGIAVVALHWLARR